MRACLFLRMVLLWAFAIAAALLPWRAEAGCMHGGGLSAAEAGASGGMAVPEMAAAAGRPMAHEARAFAHPGRGAHGPQPMVAQPMVAQAMATQISGASGEGAAADRHVVHAGLPDADGAAGGHAHHSPADGCCGPGSCRMACHVAGVPAPLPVLSAPMGRVPHDIRERPDPAALTAEVAVPPPRRTS